VRLKALAREEQGEVSHMQKLWTLLTLSTLFVCGRAVAQAPTSPTKAFQLVAPYDLLYIQDGQRVPISDKFLKVQMNGKTPEHGFFNVGGTPVAPKWKSSDPGVVECRANGEIWSFYLLGPGKATITVSVGDWSDHVDFEVISVPVKRDSTPHDLLEKYGYPTAKYRQIPSGCYNQNGDVGSGFPTEVWEYSRWPRLLLVFRMYDIEGFSLITAIPAPP
jgi:hypothetical protein